MNTQKTAVIFDMDGVIFDSERAVLQCWREVGEDFGLAGIDEVFFRCVGVNKRRTREIFLETWPALDFEAFDETVRALFRSRYDGGRLPVKPGARELLDALHTHGVPVALASSTRQETVERQLGEAGLLGYFDAVIGGDAVTRSKPDPEIFLAACAALGVKPADAYVIEDSYNGVRAAHASGMHTLMVPDLLPPDGEMREKAERIFPTLREVGEYFKELDVFKTDH